MDCRCKIVRSRIHYCSLHERAPQLLAVAEYLLAFLGEITPVDPGQANRMREIVIPYVKSQIDAAKKDVPAIRS